MSPKAAAASTSELDVLLERFFDAPRDRVWQAWTDPRLMARWWGPRDSGVSECALDVRPGGEYRLAMRSPEGVDHPMRGVYREVMRPERLVFTADLSEHPADWHAALQATLGKKVKWDPLVKLLCTVNFHEHGAGTRLTIRTRFPSSALREAFVKLGMNEGWDQSLEKLKGVLAP